MHSGHVSERLMQQRGQQFGSSECKVYHVFSGFYHYSKQEFDATQSKQAVAQSCCPFSPQAYTNTNIYIGCSHLVFQHKQIAVSAIVRQNPLPSSIFGIHLNAGAIYESDSCREQNLWSAALTEVMVASFLYGTSNKSSQAVS